MPGIWWLAASILMVFRPTSWIVSVSYDSRPSNASCNSRALYYSGGLGGRGGNWVDGRPRSGTGTEHQDQFQHVAKVRVAGSNPVFRSKVPGGRHFLNPCWLQSEVFDFGSTRSQVSNRKERLHPESSPWTVSRKSARYAGKHLVQLMCEHAERGSVRAGFTRQPQTHLTGGWLRGYAAVSSGGFMNDRS